MKFVPGCCNCSCGTVKVKVTGCSYDGSPGPVVAGVTVTLSLGGVTVSTATTGVSGITPPMAYNTTGSHLVTAHLAGWGDGTLTTTLTCPTNYGFPVNVALSVPAGKLAGAGCAPFTIPDPINLTDPLGTVALAYKGLAWKSNSGTLFSSTSAIGANKVPVWIGTQAGISRPSSCAGGPYTPNVYYLIWLDCAQFNLLVSYDVCNLTGSVVSIYNNTAISPLTVNSFSSGGAATPGPGTTNGYHWGFSGPATSWHCASGAPVDMTFANPLTNVSSLTGDSVYSCGSAEQDLYRYKTLPACTGTAPTLTGTG